MLNLSEKTQIRKVISKKSIFENFAKDFTAARRKSFAEEISRITLINELSPFSLNVEEGEQIKSIFVMRLDLRQAKFSPANLSFLSRSFGQNFIYLLCFQEQAKLAIYHQGKLYQGEFQPISSIKLPLSGLSLDRIWENLILAIADYEPDEEKAFEVQLELEEKKAKLRRKIAKLEKRSYSEPQPAKSFEIFQEIQKHKKKLENL